MQRAIKLPESHSFFLFGARGTGKSWLLRERLPAEQTHYIDLLTARDFEELSQRPGLLSERIARLGMGRQWVVIDEVQRVPEILNMVHLEIEAHSRSRMGVGQERPKERQLLFALTGSSVRKLRRGKANLLAGRAFLRHLYPLTYSELPSSYSFNDALRWGALPRVITESSDDARAELLSVYVHTYLREEILEEQLARSAPPFRRFLEVAAQTNGQILNYASIARDVGVSPHTVQSYYQILEDTLIAERIEPFHESIRKRQRTAPKFYLFDIGVQRALMGSLGEHPTPRSYSFGRLFEHFIVCELIRRNSYLERDFRFSYLRTKDGLEINLVIERPGAPRALVEIKSSERINDEHLRSLSLLGPDISNSERFCLSLDPIPRLISGIHVLPWEMGFKELGL